LRPGSTTVNGTSGTATLYELFRGTFKLIYLSMNNYQASAGGQSIALPVNFTRDALIFAGDIGINTNGGIQLLASSVAQTFNIITTLAAGGGTPTTQTTLWKWSFAEVKAGFDTLELLQMSGTHTSGCLIFGI
jgi:hypothetical protein